MVLVVTYLWQDPSLDWLLVVVDTVAAATPTSTSYLNCPNIATKTGAYAAIGGSVAAALFLSLIFIISVVVLVKTKGNPDFSKLM